VKDINKASNRTVAIAWALMWLTHPAYANVGNANASDGNVGAVLLIVFFSMSCLLAWTVLSTRRAARQAQLVSDDAGFQIDALNRHSIVTITDSDACIIDVNERLLELTGYTHAELIGKRASILYPRSEIPVYAMIKSTLARGESYTGEMRLKGKDGNTIWTQATIVPLFDQKGNHIKSISIRTDITKTKIAGAEREMRTALHLLRDEVYMFDPKSLKFTYLNQSAMDRFGWDEKTYLKMGPADAQKTFNEEAFRARAKPIMDGDVQQLNYSITSEGVPYDICLQLIQPEGASPRFVSVARDVSERKALEKTKDEFIATVSHELRSPLTSIKGSLGLILAGTTGELAERTRGMLEIARRNADRLVLIINDILDLEKIAAGEMKFVIEPTELTELVQESIAANEPYAARFGVSYQATGLDAPISVNCDMDRIFQVLTNLMTNAAKFSKPGGVVKVEVEQLDGVVRINVRDQGAGIPAAAQATIFDRFTQADSSDQRAKGGTGLGLSIVKAIVERHGGKIDFESQEGLGSNFYFDLPLSVGSNSDDVKKRTVAAR